MLKAEIYTMVEVKKQLYEQCLDFVNHRADAIKNAIHDAQESADTESKSSVGDKYETGRTMVQLEIEKFNAQLVETVKLKQVLEQINPEKPTEKVELGSLAITNQGQFYIAISAGELRVGDETYIAVSGASPIGANLMGLTANDEFTFHNKSYRVKAVY